MVVSVINLKNRPIEITDICGLFFFITCFFPFLSIIPLKTDLQPLNIIFGFVFYFLIKIKTLKFSREELFFLFFSFFFLIYISPYGDFEKLNVFKYLTFSISVVLPLIMLNGFYIKYKIFNAFLIVYFIIGIAFYINPTLIFNLQGFFVNVRTEASIFVERGISPLSPEPSFFAAILFAFLFINEYLLENGKNKNNVFYFNFLMILILCVLNKSGSIVVYFIFYMLLTSKLKYLKFFIPFIGVYIFISYDFSGTRIFNIINLLSNGDILSDRSLVNRLSDYISGFYSLLINPFGVTSSNLSEQLSFIGNELNIVKYKNNDLNGVTSAISYGLISYGVFFVIWLFFLLQSSKAKYKYKLAALLLMSFSVSYAFPLSWVLLYLGHSDKNEKKHI